MQIVIKLDHSKYLFVAIASAIAFLVGRKLAYLQSQIISCDVTIRDKFINNILITSNVNNLRSDSQHNLKDEISIYNQFTKDELDRAKSSTYLQMIDKEYSSLFSVFKYLHHPGYPSDGEIILTLENKFQDDFKFCTSVYATRSGVRSDDTQPSTCVAIVRVPGEGGYVSPQSISHRNGTTIYPQVLTSQYQDDNLKWYTLPRQHEWVNAFLSKRTELVDSFIREVGDPIDSNNKRRTLLVMIANEGAMDFVLNFMCSALSANIDMSSFVVIVGQEEYVQIIHSMGAKAFYDIALGAVPRNFADTYADRTFTKVMWMKMTAGYLALNAGFNMIFQDTDLVWIKDPTEYLYGVDADMIFMDDGARTLRFGPLFTNTGFYFTRYTPKTLFLQERLIRSAGEIDYTSSHQATFIRHLIESHYLFGLKVLILDDHEFPSGQMYHHQKDFVNQVKKHEFVPYVWHMCWTDNREQKISYLKDLGMWFLQPSDYMSGMCESGADMMRWFNRDPNNNIMHECCVMGDYWASRSEQAIENR